eukprot:1721093-Rhodomonas_salina.2
MADTPVDAASFPELGAKEEKGPKRTKMPKSERPPRANGQNKGGGGRGGGGGGGGGSAAAAAAAANGQAMDEAAPLVKPGEQHALRTATGTAQQMQMWNTVGGSLRSR